MILKKIYYSHLPVKGVDFAEFSFEIFTHILVGSLLLQSTDENFRVFSRLLWVNTLSVQVMGAIIDNIFDRLFFLYLASQ